jgi:hypothetical protein
MMVYLHPFRWAAVLEGFLWKYEQIGRFARKLHGIGGAPVVL